MRGRDRELKVALDMIRAAEAGLGGVLLVEGEPGIGKSRFLEESAAAAAATARGFTPAWGRTGESPPGTVASRLLRTQQEEFVTPAAGDGQLVVVLDDLQRASTAMLWALRGLARRTQLRPPLWILARNTGSAYSDAQWLFGHLERSGAARVQLGPLDDEAVTGVVTEILGAPANPEVLALAAGAGGNPLLLIELLAGLRDEGRIRADGEPAGLASGPLPQRLRAVVHRWVAALGPRARQLLAIGAVLGRSFTVDNVAALLGETPARLLPEVEAALAADLLVATPEALVFSRELVWRALTESVPPPARQALHRQIGELLLDQGGSAIEASTHLLSGSRPCAPAALTRLDCAARTFLASAPRTAVDLALKALALSEPTDQDWFPRIVTAVQALTAVGRLSEAEERAAATLAAPVLVPRPVELRLRSLLSCVLLCSGRPAAAISLAEELLGEPELCAEARDEAELTLMLGLCASAEDIEWADERAAAILAGAGRYRDASQVAALLVRAVIAWREGRLPPRWTAHGRLPG